MFNDDELPPLPAADPGRSEADRPERRTFDVSLLSTAELLSLRGRIDERLPAMKLGSMNLEEELVLQFQTVKALQNDTLEDRFVEPNKKASVVNACASALSQIVKMQTDLHTAERFKTVEGLMIKALKTLPLETIEPFLVEYEKMGAAL
jgi:hypothetical protein